MPLELPGLRVVLLAFSCLVIADAGAQTYPSRPVRMIVPAPPGGSTDFLGRLAAQKLGEAVRQQVVVDNRGGGGGVVGAETVARAPADGHTLGVIYTQHTVLPHLQKQLPYDPIRDFAPITVLTSSPLILVVHPALPVQSVKDLVALARAKPLAYGSAGNGSGGHLSGEMLKQMAKIDATHVPYKGAGPAAVDVAGGQLQFQFGAQITTQALIKSGRLRAIAVSSTKRAPAFPDVPTVAESGLPGFEFANWFGVVAPARTPAAIRAQLHKTIAGGIQQPDVRDKLVAEGSEIVANSPEAFAALLKSEIAKWGKVVAAAGMRAD